MLLIPFPGFNAGRFFTTFTEFQVPTYLPTVYCIASSSTLHCDIIYLPRQAEPLLVIAVIAVFRSSVFDLLLPSLIICDGSGLVFAVSDCTKMENDSGDSSKFPRPRSLKLIGGRSPITAFDYFNLPYLTHSSISI